MFQDIPVDLILHNPSLQALWTQEDSLLFRSRWETACPRSVNACENMALKLGVSAQKLKWTDAEIEILRENYPKLGKAVAELLPGRTAMTCQAKSMSSPDCGVSIRAKTVFSSMVWFPAASSVSGLNLTMDQLSSRDSFTLETAASVDLILRTPENASCSRTSLGGVRSAGPVPWL